MRRLTKTSSPAQPTRENTFTQATVTGHRFIVILGPTASGKSSLGVQLANRFKGVILSADSRQVYTGLNIGTAKITQPEMSGVPHYLLDISSPKRIFTVAQFQAASQRVLNKIPTTTPVFIVGGSPFYIEAILSPTPFPNVPPNPALRRRLERRTVTQVMQELRRSDPARAAAMDPNNKRRLIRALEIVAALGRVPTRPITTHANVLKIGIDVERGKLYTNIDRRLDQRVPGTLREIQKLHAQGLSWKRMDQLGLEYRWLSKVVRHTLDRSTAVERLKGDIHAFARRQLTWWRRDHDIRWITNKRSAQRFVINFLR